MKRMADKGLETPAEPAREISTDVTGRERNPRSLEWQFAESILATEERDLTKSEILLDDFEGILMWFGHGDDAFAQMAADITALHFAADERLAADSLERHRHEAAQKKRRRWRDLLIEHERIPDDLRRCIEVFAADDDLKLPVRIHAHWEA